MTSQAKAPDASVEDNFDYQQFANALEEVTYWHLAWYSQVMAVLTLDRRHPAMNYHECRFGRFMDSTLPPPGRETEFQEINDLHRKMHACARTLLCDPETDGRINAEAFDELAEMQTLFVGACNTLLRAALIDGCVLTTHKT